MTRIEKEIFVIFHVPALHLSEVQEFCDRVLDWWVLAVRYVKEI